MNRMTSYKEFSKKNELAIKAKEWDCADLNEIISSDDFKTTFEVFFKRFDSDEIPDELNVINIGEGGYNRIDIINLRKFFDKFKDIIPEDFVTIDDDIDGIIHLDLRNKDDKFIKELFEGAFNSHLESLKAAYHDEDYGEYKYPGYIEANGYDEIADLIFNYVNLVEPGTESKYVHNKRFIRRDRINEKSWIYVRNIILRVHTKENLDITMFDREVDNNE